MAYFTTAEFRAAMPDMDDEAKYPDVRVTLAQGAVEALIEKACGTQFVTTAVTETVSGSGTYDLELSAPYVQAITSVTENGVLLTGYTYSVKNGRVRRVSTGTYSPAAWACGDRNIVVVYSSGYSTTCPNDLKMAAMLATRDRVLALTASNGKPSSRVTSMTNEVGGTMTFAVASPDRPTGNPDVDATIMRYAAKTNPAGF